MRLAHLVVFNEGNQEADARVLVSWSAQEELDMARAEHEYTGRFPNEHLHRLFPHRTIDAIKAHRRQAPYIALRDRVSADLGEAASPPRASEDGLLSIPSSPIPFTSGPSTSSNHPTTSRGYRRWSAMENSTLGTVFLLQGTALLSKTAASSAAKGRTVSPETILKAVDYQKPADTWYIYGLQNPEIKRKTLESAGRLVRLSIKKM